MITLSAEQESDGSQLSTNPFSLYTTLKIGGNPKPRAGQDKKNEGNYVFKPLHPAWNAPVFWFPSSLMALEPRRGPWITHGFLLDLVT